MTETITRDNLPKIGDLLVSSRGNLTLVLSDLKYDESIDSYECQGWYLNSQKRGEHFNTVTFYLEGTGWKIFARA